MEKDEKVIRPEKFNKGNILKKNEAHPACATAVKFLFAIPLGKLKELQSIMEANALNGNRLAKICSWSLSRFLDGKKMTDRDILGLAWTLSIMLNEQIRDEKEKKNVDQQDTL
jgi:hypothetical protein